MNFYHLILMAPSGGEGGGGGMSFLLFIGLIFIVMYFFMIRPQTKKARNQKLFLQNIKKGDRVVTIGGIHGRIVQVNDDSYMLEVDSNTKLKIEKSVISLDFTKALYDRSATQDPANKKKE